MKKVLIIVIAIIIVLVISVIALINKLESDVDKILTEPITEIDLSEISNGTYQGTYKEALAVNATVNVTVENNIITTIEIVEHQNGQGSSAEIILENIITSQSTLVDDIAGATYSSRVLKLAVVNAFKEE